MKTTMDHSGILALKGLIGLIGIGCYIGLSPMSQGAAHRSPPGSQERTDICDVIRPYIVSHYGTKDIELPPVTLKVLDLNVDVDYAFFQGIPMFANGRPMSADYMMDANYMFILKKENGAWGVIDDLTRDGVPSKEAAAAIKARLPQDMPYSILTRFWKNQFR